MITLAPARRAAGMTQAQAAALLGKTQSHYSKIERGAVDLSARDLATLVTAWRICPSQLLTVPDFQV